MDDLLVVVEVVPKPAGLAPPNSDPPDPNVFVPALLCCCPNNPAPVPVVFVAGVPPNAPVEPNVDVPVPPNAPKPVAGFGAPNRPAPVPAVLVDPKAPRNSE